MYVIICKCLIIFFWFFFLFIVKVIYLVLWQKWNKFFYEINIYSIDLKYIYIFIKDMMLSMRLFKIYIIVLYIIINILIEYYFKKGVNEF